MYVCNYACMQLYYCMYIRIYAYMYVCMVPVRMIRIKMCLKLHYIYIGKRFNKGNFVSKQAIAPPVGTQHYCIANSYNINAL